MRAEHFAAGAFAGTLSDSGVLHVRFQRPPVNAFSIAEYEALGQMVDHIEAHPDIRVLLVSADPNGRAWCGGADLRDFDGITKAKRRERYEFINRVLPRFQALNRPTIAAIHTAAIGVGMVLASLFDFRIAAATTRFALPEVDFGLMSGCAGRFMALRLPEPKLREMLYTGAVFEAQELESTGFFNYVVAAENVLPKALELAGRLAAKDSVTMRARKRDSLAIEGTDWIGHYLRAQETSGEFVSRASSRNGVSAALEGRSDRV